MTLDWYNRGGREFDNGVTWVRVRPLDFGLWWSWYGSRDTCAPLVVFVGRFGVGVLTPNDDCAFAE